MIQPVLKQNSGFAIFLVVLLLWLPQSIDSQDSTTFVYFNSPKQTYHPQETQIVVDVLLDSSQEINAFSLEIGYNVQTLAFLSASDEDSIVDV